MLGKDSKMFSELLSWASVFGSWLNRTDWFGNRTDWFGNRLDGFVRFWSRVYLFGRRHVR